MKKPALLFCLCLPLFLPAQPRHGDTFLYGILPAGGDTSKISWLFGTMHHFGSEFVFAHQELLSLARTCDVIVTEVDRETLLAGPAAKSPNELKSPVPLDELLTREDYQFVKQQVSEYLEQDIEPYRELMPLVLLEFLTIARRQARGDTLKKGGSMDAYFQAIAVLFEKPNIGLETAEEFLAMQRSIPLSEQTARLLYELDRSPEEMYHQTQLPMETCYKRQDLTCFCAVDDMEHYSLPPDETMIKKRNLLWMRRLPDILNMGSAFVAVGAAHLCGAEGLPALLRKAGFRVVGLPYK